MYLSNPFSQETRLMYLYEYECRWCGTNGGGCLELHHIVGRDSNSIFNSALICKDCHGKMCHNQTEEQHLFAKTFIWLYTRGYKPNENDFEFIRKYYSRLFTPSLELWIKHQ